MKTSKLLLAAGLLMAGLSSHAQEEPLWMRYTAISPDGKTIAFSYKGDIYSVAATGGQARQLTTNAAYDACPVWSPDGSKLAFASSREGSIDVYVMDAKGSEPVRLTTNSTNEMPMAWRDNEHVLFSASWMPSAQSILFPGDNQVYEVSIKGGRPRMFSTLPMEDISFAKDGRMLYHDYKGYEDPYRKHHQSPICRDIWMVQDGHYTRLTDFKGEDRTPRWADANSYYYTSEEDGTFNVYRRNIDGTGKKQLSHHKMNPVRYLTVSNDGTLCYSQNGEIYTLKEGAEPQKVKVTVTADRQDKDLIRQIRQSGVTEISLSPDAKEVAFIVRGDIFVTSVEYKTTKQITNTPQQERSVSFSPDGRSLVYCAERGGVWQIYQTKLKNKNEKLFTYATELEEERLTNSNETSLQPQYSPDGKEVAYFKNRAELCVINLKTRQERTVLDGKYNFSYRDGDLWFEWSPDSKWLLASYIGTGGWNSIDIALVNASGNGEVHNLTESGYDEGAARWVLGGKAMLFESDRAGYRSHGSWGSESDYYVMFFDVDAYDRFTMSKEDKERLDEAEKEAKKEEKKDDKDAKNAKKKDSKKKAAEKPKAEKLLTFDLDNCRDRIVRVTDNSARMGDAVLKGDTLYYQASFEGGADLWVHYLREDKTELLMKGVGRGRMFADKKFNNLFLASRGGIKKLDLGKKSTKNVDFEAVFNYRPYEEREYLFDHIWRQVKDKFYVENLHQVDWEGYRDNYRRFLPYINNEYDFKDMLSEMLGELNASHTGARYYPDGATLSTASLGVFIDQNYQGDGLRIEEVIKRSPLAQKKTGVVAGCVIEAIDGVTIKADDDYFPLLDGKVGKRVRLTVLNPSTGKRNDVTIKAISRSAQNELLYKRWVDRQREMTDSLSGGKLAYVHVKAMDSPSYRTVYRELLSDKNRNRVAAVVDERHNGGGWLHDDLCTLLSGKKYQEFVPHGKYVGSDPYNKWVKPSCVLMCEDDYSNGHGFPWVYKELKIGKLIGTPVAGTMTAVWWETLQNGMIFGIPQVGCRDMRGVFGENSTLYPDIEVYNTPEDYISGRDRQLERAVQEMLR